MCLCGVVCVWRGGGVSYRSCHKGNVKRKNFPSYRPRTQVNTVDSLFFVRSVLLSFNDNLNSLGTPGSVINPQYV